MMARLRPVPLPLLPLPLLLLLLLAARRFDAAPLSVVHSVSNLWGGVAFEAAEVRC
jgi:hypothetical protein